jgi:hypothetical protein
MKIIGRYNAGNKIAYATGNAASTVTPAMMIQVSFPSHVGVIESTI